MSRVILTIFGSILFPLLAQADACRLAIFFGYNDQRPDDLVVDGIQRTLLENRLTGACYHAGDLLCAWTRTSYGDEGNLRRNFGGREVEIRLRSSSMTKSDRVNRGQLAAQQNAVSYSRRAQFLASFADSDVVMYVGHSRFGDGPDFSAPILRSSGAVHSEAYRARGGSSANEIAYVAQSSARWSAFDIISCDSRDHFAALFARLGGDVSFVNIPVRPEQADAILHRQLDARLRGCF